MIPPALTLLVDHDNHWPTYEEAIYQVFLADIVHSGLRFRGCPIKCRKHPETRGRSFGFWHLVQEGRVEEDRVPDLRRCERIGWIKTIIENADDCDNIYVWENERNNKIRVPLWYAEEYIIILEWRGTYWLLITAYCTEKEHRKASLRRERDQWGKSQQT